MSQPDDPRDNHQKIWHERGRAGILLCHALTEEKRKQRNAGEDDSVECDCRIVAQQDRTHPIALKVPAASSISVIRPTSNGTIPASGLFAKWPLSHARLPFQSSTLSMPDCKKRIAKKAEIRLWSAKIEPREEWKVDIG